jgi:hypothetical protein
MAGNADRRTVLVTQPPFDLRTRFDTQPTVVGSPADELHRLADLSASAPWWGEAVGYYDPTPLVLTVDRSTFRLRANREGLALDEAGSNTETGRVVRLDLSREDFEDMLADRVTPIGWWSSGHLDIGRHLHALLDWWVLLIALADHRVPYLGGTIEETIRNNGGGPVLEGPATGALDGSQPWERSFDSRRDDPAEMREFLGTYGFLHLRGLFTDDDMAAVSTDMDAMAASYSPGDGRSWWATDSSGTEHLVRCHEADTRSPAIAELVTRADFLALGDLPGVGHKWAPRATNRIEALNKPLDIVSGISDVPWHKDCSLGRHSYMCCRLTVGIAVTPGTETSGLLRVVAGSNHAHMWPALSRPSTPHAPMRLPVVPLSTARGDVTIHLSCTLHEALPPTAHTRRVLYTDFGLPDAVGAQNHDPRISRIREAAATTVSQPRADGVRPSFG